MYQSQPWDDVISWDDMEELTVNDDAMFDLTMSDEDDEG